MKKHESIVRRVREVEEKHGIKYLKPDSKLFVFLRVIYTLAVIYTFSVNLLIIAGVFFRSDEHDYVNFVITVSICTALIVLGYILMCVKKIPFIIGSGISIVPVPLLAVVCSNWLKDDFGLWGLSKKYYFCHFIPLAVMLVFLIIMSLIYITATYKFNRRYKQIVENLYKTHRPNNAISEGDASDFTEEQWNEFLANYDPHDHNYAAKFEEQLEKPEDCEEES